MTKVTLSKHTHRATAYVEAEVDVSLSDIESDELVAELELRGDLPAKLPKSLETFPQGTMSDVLDVLETRGLAEGIKFVTDLVRPRWKSREECEAEYKKLRTALTPDKEA